MRTGAPGHGVVALLLAATLAACSSGSESAAPDTVPATTSTLPGTSAATTSVAATPTTALPATTVVASSVPPVEVAPGTPIGDVFPGEEWALGELPTGVDRAVVDEATDAAFGGASNLTRVRSIVVVEGGEIVYERYHPLDSPDTIMPSWSVAKSFTSAVIGLLVGDGLLDLDAPAPVEEWADPADPRHEITIEDMLHMSSGLEWAEVYGPDTQPAEMFLAEDASEYAASLPLEAEPGERFEYSTGTTAILAGIITDTLGGPEQADAYIRERLLDPIGITSTVFRRDGSGRWYGGLGADSTARDFARFGLLYLNDGVWDGTRILPEGWVEYSRIPAPTNSTYGAHWWMLRPDAFEARGLCGQIIAVSQPHDLVVVITTNCGGDADTLIGEVYAELTGGVPPSEAPVEIGAAEVVESGA